MIRTTDDYTSPGFTWVLYRRDCNSTGFRYYWRRSRPRIALLWLAAAGVGALLAYGCCN
jgi:hypothetical protein